MSDELIDIVDTNNNTIGQILRSESYRQHKSHRVVHVMAIRESKVLIVKRGLSLKYLPGYYCSSAGGHVHAFEKPDAAALREMHEEIGLKGPVEFIETIRFKHDFEIFIEFYIKRMSCEEHISTNPREVHSAQFYSKAELDALDTNLFHPQMTPCLERVKQML